MTEQSRLGPPPIEPLSDTAWARVERGLWSRLDAESAARMPVAEAPRRWWLAAVPLAAAAAALAVVLWSHESPPPPGDPPSRVMSGSAPSLASFGDAHIELDAHTTLVLNRENEHPAVLVEDGAAWFTVAPRLSRPSFLVHAGDATVRVVGTRFRVLRSGERIGVEVDHGLVDVTFRGGVVAVGAGQRWSSEDPGRIAAIAVAPAAPAAPAELPPAPSEDSPPAPPPAAPAPPTRSHVHRPARQPAAASAPPVAEPAPAAPPIAATPPGDPDAAEYDRLAALEPKSPSAALTGYLALARRTSPWAAPALFAAARLAFEHRDSRAETLLGIYLQRFPTGANAADARQLLARLKTSSP